MAISTLLEVQNHTQDQLISAVAESIITLDPMYERIPFFGYAGNAILHNVEATIGDTQILARGGLVTANAQATTIQETFTSLTAIGHADVGGLDAAHSGGGNLLAYLVESKAKSVGLKLRQGLATGAGGVDYNSLHTMAAPTQYTTASAGQALTFALIDELLDLVKAKNGVVDFIVMPAAQLRKFKELFRAYGGATPDTIKMESGRAVFEYDGIPVFKNENLKPTETANGAATTGGVLSSVYAGCFDDGSMRTGLAAIHPESSPAGIQITSKGELQDYDTQRVSIKQYANWANFNPLALARLPSLV